MLSRRVDWDLTPETAKSPATTTNATRLRTSHTARQFYKVQTSTKLSDTLSRDACPRCKRYLRKEEKGKLGRTVVILGGEAGSGEKHMLVVFYFFD